MSKLIRRSARAWMLIALVAASVAATGPARAEPYTYPPIYDPTREIKERVNETRDSVEDAIADPMPSDPDVTGQCLFQGATIEGAAVFLGLADTTGIVCRVYDETGVQRGGCAMFMTGSAAACAAPTDVVLGPPTVCTEAYAIFSWGVISRSFCE